MKTFKYVFVLMGVWFFFGPWASGAPEPALTEQVINPLQPEGGETLTDPGPNVLQAPEGENWFRDCDDEADSRTCRIVQNIFLEKDIDGEKQRVGRVLQVVVVYATDPGTAQRGPYISINLPLGVDLRPGAVVRIDEEQEFQLPFLQCVNNGCALSRDIDGDLLRQLRMGVQLNVGFRAWGEQDVTIIPASLIGFTRAFETIQ